MKRSTKCIAQTINLSNPKTCVKPKVQKLVSTDTDSRSDSSRTTKWIARPVTVKVCSRKDIQQKCPPKLHTAVCLEKPLSNSERFYGIAMYLLKGAIAAGLIYWTYVEGLWGNSTETEDLYYRIMSEISPTDRPIHLEGIRYSMSETYNRALVKCMDIIVGLPLEMHRKLRELFSCDVTRGKEEAHGKHISTDENST